MGYAREAMRRIASKMKGGQKNFTASETGARREALRRLGTGENDYGKLVKKMTAGGVKVGVMRGPSQSEMEDMIRRGS